MGNLIDAFNPLQSFLSGQQGRVQFDQNQRAQEIAGLQSQLAQQGGGLESPLTQQIAALSGDPLGGFQQIDKAKQEKVIRNAEKNSNFIRRGQPERALSSAVFDRNKLIDLDPEADTSGVDSAIQSLSQGIALDEQGGGFNLGNYSTILSTLDRTAGLKASSQLRTASSRDFDQFQDLLRIAKQSGDPADAERAEQFGRQARFIKNTEQQSSDIKTTAAEARETAKFTVKRKQGFIDAGVDAADSTANIRRSIKLLDSVETGGIDNVLLQAKQLFGIEGADEAELSANLGKSILAQLKPIFGAAFTAAEGERLERIEARFGKSPAANKRLLKQVLKIAERAARRGLAAAEDQDDQFTAEEIRKSLAFKLEENDFTSPQQAPVQSQATQQQTAPVQQAQTFNFDAQGNLIP